MLGRKADIRIGGDFSTVPADKYTVQIADVNFKTLFNKWKNQEEEMLNFQYVVLNEKPMPETEDGKDAGTTRGRFIWHKVSQSLSTKSWLMKLAKAVYGRDLTKEELDPKSPKFFDPEKLIGKQVDIMVTEDPNKDNTAMFNNVVSYSKTVKPLEPLPLTKTGQTVIESETKPAVAEVDVPNLNPGLDNFLDDLEKDKEETKTEDPEETEDQEEEAEEEESLEELEAKLKLAKAKAKEAKAKKK